MKIATFELADWFRKHYFDTEIVLCVSGVEEFSLGEIRKLFNISQEELDRIILNDSPSYGASGLRKAIAQRWRNGEQEHVLVTHGSSEAMFLIMNTLLRPEDEVIIMTPCYQPLLSIPEALNCRVKSWALQPEQQFVPDIETLKNLLTPSTRMVVVNVPNNPTGATLLVEQQNELVNAVADAGAYLLWDTAFTELSYDTSPLMDPGLTYNRTITLGTLTKTYGLGGLRVGWCLAEAEILEQCVRLRDYITLNLSPLIEYIAQKVVENIDDISTIRLQQSRFNRNILTKWVEEHEDFVDWTRPQGGVSSFIKFKNMANTDIFCSQLASKYNVFLLPGQCFGHPSYVRLGFGGPTSILEEGLLRISHALKQRTIFDETTVSMPRSKM